MLKKFTATALGIASVLSFNLPVLADDTEYPLPFRSYLTQLALESDWIREGIGNKHYHFITYAPTGRVIGIANTTCASFKTGQVYQTIKANIEADSNSMFPADVVTKIGASSISRFADVAIKSAVINTCPEFSSSLPQLNYVLPKD